jgi:hypothetical protein
VRRQTVQCGGTGIPASGFLAARFFKVNICASVFGNGISHRALTTRKTTRTTRKQSNSEIEDTAKVL